MRKQNSIFSLKNNNLMNNSGPRVISLGYMCLLEQSLAYSTYPSKFSNLFPSPVLQA